MQIRKKWLFPLKKLTSLMNIVKNNIIQLFAGKLH